MMKGYEIRYGRAWASQLSYCDGSSVLEHGEKNYRTDRCWLIAAPDADAAKACLAKEKGLEGAKARRAMKKMKAEHIPDLDNWANDLIEMGVDDDQPFFLEA